MNETTDQVCTSLKDTTFDAKHISTFNHTLQELITDLTKAFPELETIVEEKYSTIADHDTQFIEWFKTHTQKHIMALTVKDESIFETHDSMFLLPDINFSELWKCALTKSNKSAVWKYLHVLLLLVSHHSMPKIVEEECQQTCDTSQDTLSVDSADNSANVNSDLNKENSMQTMFEKWNSMLDSKEHKLSDEQLQEMKMQSENVMRLMQSLSNTEPDVEDTEDDGTKPTTNKDDSNPFEGMENDPFVKQLENSKIAQFAKELSQDLNMSDLGLGDLEKEEPKSFNDMFGKLGKDPSKLFGLVETVGSKIQNKMQNGDIKQNELVEEAQHLMQSMTKSGIFKNAFGNMNKAGKKKTW